MSLLFDTHAHYDDPKFSENGADPDLLIEEMLHNDVDRILGVSVDVASAERQLAFAHKHGNFYAALGVHPENCADCGDPDETLAVIERMLKDPKAVSIGEIGLDYHWEENAPKEMQKIWFDKQLSLAEKLDLPVIVHDRDAHGDTFDLVCSHKNVRGVFHCYSGSGEMALHLLRRGWYLSFTGVVTFPKTERLAAVVRSVPLERLLIETDCPYMAPVPMRGKVNRSSYALYTAERIAQVKEVSTEELLKITNENARRLFGIS